MSKAAYTARELAEMQLPSLPKGREHISKLATKEGWPARERDGRGGGREFIFDGLPQQVRHEIMQRGDGTTAPPVEGDRAAAARARILKEFRAFGQDMPMEKAEREFMALYDAQRLSGAVAPFPRWIFDAYPAFSVQGLRRWRKRASDEGSAIFHAKRGRKKGDCILARANNGAVASSIQALLKQHGMSTGRIRDLIRIEYGRDLQVDGRTELLPTIRSFQRYIDGWKRDNPELYLRLTNPDGWRNSYMLALGDADGDIGYANQRWEIDASPLDVMCLDGRCTVYGVIDIWTRRVLFHLSPTAKTEGALQTIRRAALEWGIPDVIKTDNGKDFVSARFTGALDGLEIEHVTSGPFQPWKKAFVERVIGTFQHSFTPAMPGHTGHSVADRQKIRSQQSFADTLGAAEKETFNVTLTREEMQRHIDAWVTGYYHQQPHSAFGVSPLARAAGSMVKPRMVVNIRALDMLLAPVAGARSIRKTGIRVEGADFWNDTLGLHMGKEVFVRLDAADMGRIYAFDLEGRFLCEAQNLDRLGSADRQTVAARAKALQNQHIAAETKEIRRTYRKKYSEGKVAEMLLRDNMDAAARVTAFPKQTENYTTPSLDEAARAVTKESIPLERTAEQKASQEAFVEKLLQRQKERAAKAAEPSWKERCSAIEAQLAGGEQLSDSDAKWYGHIQTTPPYLAWKRFQKLQQAQVEGA